MNANNTSPQLLAPLEYIKLATKLVRKAERRVYLVCLNMDQCKETADFIDAILKAAKRGVDIHVGNDLLTFLCDRDGSVASRLVGPEMLRTRNIRKQFVKSGAEFSWLGMQRIPYILGRTHSKWTIIDDHVFSFGGVNLSHSSLVERADYMFHVENPRLADAIAREQIKLEKMRDTKQMRDTLIPSEFGTVIVDSGKFGRSSIYRHAVALAKEAESLLIVSQYCPSGKLANIMQKKNTKLYFNPKGSANDKVNNFMIGRKQLTSQQINLYTRRRYIHSKFIIGTMPDGSKRAITGSHNFAAISGRAGTHEIALETTSQSIIEQIEKFWQDNIA